MRRRKVRPWRWGHSAEYSSETLRAARSGGKKTRDEAINSLRRGKMREGGLQRWQLAQC